MLQQCQLLTTIFIVTQLANAITEFESEFDGIDSVSSTETSLLNTAPTPTITDLPKRKTGFGLNGDISET